MARIQMAAGPGKEGDSAHRLLAVLPALSLLILLSRHGYIPPYQPLAQELAMTFSIELHFWT